MAMEALNSTPAADTLEALRRELAQLGERVAALEKAVGQSHGADRGSRNEDSLRPQAQEGISEEILLVISAAIAAYLGIRPHIRQVRLLGSTAWAQQGRVTVQASHALAVRHS
jgi:methylmalonyl-CoA carboxyltransferase large subunit